ncbi:MAG: hypothetical protein SFV21_12630 [Rhodospirillaceae bacterium]|nr:hypothetical protein [Rhodospirillaceae bacterium]
MEPWLRCAHAGCAAYGCFGFRVAEGHPARVSESDASGGRAGSAWYCAAHRAEGEALLRAEVAPAASVAPDSRYGAGSAPHRAQQGSLF